MQHLPLGGTAALHAPLQLELSPLRHLPLGQFGAPLQPELSPLRQWPAEGTAPVGAQPIAAPALGGQHSNRSPAHCGACPLEASLQPELGPLRLLSSSGIVPVGAQLPGGSCPRGALLRPERSANAPVALGWLCSSGVRPVRQVLADGFDPTGAQPIAATALGGTATSGGPPLGFVTACDASRDHRHVADVRSKHALPPLSWAVAGQGGMAQGSCPHGLQALRGPSPRPRLIVSRLLQAPRQPSQLLRPCQPSLAHLSSTFVCVASTRRSVEDRAAARPAWSSGGKASFAAGRRSSCRPTQ